jgi:ribosome biogenesis GTPase / thiamine phosphate phosphatase
MEVPALASRKDRAQEHILSNHTTRQLRKQVKPNRYHDPVRRKDWMDSLVEEDEMESVERVMPRGELERRRANLASALARLAQLDSETEEGDCELGDMEAQPGEVGLVVEISTNLCQVIVRDQMISCSLRGSIGTSGAGYTHVVAVGDRVRVSFDAAGGGVVHAVLPRSSVLARPDVADRHHRQQIVVANADQLLIVAAWRNPPMWLELVDRYLICAARAGMTPVLCVNKIDLADEVDTPYVTMKPYVELGHRMVFTSARTNAGIEELRGLLCNHTTAVTGVSGVGKSSLLAAVQPGLQLRTAAVGERSGEGQHTTTQTTMIPLKSGGYVIDTPGIREFGLAGLRRSGLSSFFPEIVSASVVCRFDDCSHLNEPGCAVRSAVNVGRIAQSRYHSYRKIYEELP